MTVINSTLIGNQAQGGTNSSGTNGQGLGGGVDQPRLDPQRHQLHAGRQ